MKRFAFARTFWIIAVSIIIQLSDGDVSYGQSLEKTSSFQPQKPISGDPLPIGLAEQAENEMDYEKALELYARIKQARPKWAHIQMRIAICQAQIEKKEDAEKTLRDLLQLKSIPSELAASARSALQELLLPKLDETQRNDWKRALIYVQAGEELKQREREDLEIRIHKKLFAQPYLEAKSILERLTKEQTKEQTKELRIYAPAFLTLGIVYENLADFDNAAKAFQKYLEFGELNNLPELEQQERIRVRKIVCEQRHLNDVNLSKRVVGKWEVFCTFGEQPILTTVVSGNTSTTTTKPLTSCRELQLLPGGKVNFLAARSWIWQKDASWKVIDGRLYVSGAEKGPNEWCDMGQLAANGHQFDGSDMNLHRRLYVRRGELSDDPNPPSK